MNTSSTPHPLLPALSLIAATALWQVFVFNTSVINLFAGLAGHLQSKMTTDLSFAMAFNLIHLPIAGGTLLLILITCWKKGGRELGPILFSACFIAGAALGWCVELLTS